MTIDLLALDEPTNTSFRMHMISKINGLPIYPPVAPMLTSLRSARGIEYAGKTSPIFYFVSRD